MNYLLFIWAHARPAPDELAVLQRKVPAWVEEMDGRGVRLLGRELELPETAATVRVRDGETLVSDGPFTETKEFIAGFDLLECADQEEAIEVAATSPVSWFQTIEVRPFAETLTLGEQVSTFARSEDAAGTPYVLMAWVGGRPAQAFDEQAVGGEVQAWREDLETRGLLVLGNTLAGPDSATTVRVRAGETLRGDGPVTGRNEFVAAIDVVRCADRPQAIDLASAHPIARSHAIEVRPFYRE